LQVEGHVLAGSPELLATFDVIITVSVTAETAWGRRRSRADEMQGWPEGTGDNCNYEILVNYKRACDTAATFLAPARARYGEDEGNLAWLRLYFEEVLWPAAEAQSRAVAALAASSSLGDGATAVGGRRRPRVVHTITNDGADGKEAWLAAQVPAAMALL
jgi:hypothetical protein